MTIRTDPVRLDDTRPAAAPERDLLPKITPDDERLLHALGEGLARGERGADLPSAVADVAARSAFNAARLTAAVAALETVRRASSRLNVAAEWLLDNSYMVDDAARQVRRDLPKRFYRQLPRTRLADGADAPRALAIVWAYAEDGGGVTSAARFEALVRGFQSVEPLQIGELWALPSLLRHVLLERLANVAEVTARALSLDAPAGIEPDPAGEALAGQEAGTLVRSLRRVNDIDWTVWFEGLSAVDRTLRDHTDFAELDFASRDQYRKAVEEIAKRARRVETEVAARAVALAAERAAIGACGDIGWLLVGEGRPLLERSFGCSSPVSHRLRRFYRRTGWAGVTVPVLVTTALLLLAAASALQSAGVAGGALAALLLLAALPASEAALALFNLLATLLVPPRMLIGYEYKGGVPAEARTLVVVPTLIASRDEVEEAVGNLEVHYLSNMGGEIHFAILSDWPDADEEETETDRDLLELARTRVEELNRKHSRAVAPRFYLLHRRRLYNAAEGVWMGWERKRGKLDELNALLRGETQTTYLPHDPRLPRDIRYVMTLDADTRMTRDAVRRLVGKMQHPLNRPVIDGRTRRVVSGHGILQPRVTASLTTGDEASFFQRVYSSNRGMDPYVFAVSNVYQDVFGSGSFTGKGLYDVDAMRTALAGRIPENAVLSHDLLEGAYANAGFASDVELVEDYPTRYTVDVARHHRWTRGDWQLLPFLFSPRAGVPGLSRWKMFDNLRRSLLPLGWIAASAAGWWLLPLGAELVGQAVLLVGLFLAPTVEVVRGLLLRPRDASYRGHVRAALDDCVAATFQVMLNVVFAAHIAWSMLDAIVRTLYRMAFSRRRLLEWRTASQAARAARGGLWPHMRAMWGVVPVVAVVVAPLLFGGVSTAGIGTLFVALWLASPLIACVVSRPLASEEHLRIEDRVALQLRLAARRTWSYFETFVTAENNMLPPDNFQDAPVPVLAARTSPTNVGMYLLSVVSARDFGWISLAEAVERVDRTLSVIERMERHRGHLYNWYDTRTLEVLAPRYVSTVDSGNLAGHLVTLAGACRMWAEAPALHLHGDYSGISDVTHVMDEALGEIPDDRKALRPLRGRLAERLAGLRRSVEELRADPSTASIRIEALPVVAYDIRKLVSALHDETRSQKTRDLVAWAGKLESTCAAHVADVQLDEDGIAMLRAALVETAERARRFALEMDFAFLFRKDRKLLSIGYRQDEAKLDDACYDLLASEARLTSLFGIAKGDLPTEHWFRLGRPLTEIAFRGALVSWSGSMFEYLMPPLVMKEPLGGILNQTSNLVIRRQIAYGRRHRVPWGVSEAAYSARDRDMTYQYMAFGVPGLGLKRGLSQDMVVAPYASFLAAQFDPEEAARNLRVLRLLGAAGTYGYVDAVDFTPQRMPAGKRHVVVRTWMAHHQGMSIVAVANAILNGRMRDRFHSDPLIEAAELLLQQKAPREIVSSVSGDAEAPIDLSATQAPRRGAGRKPASARATVPSHEAREPALHHPAPEQVYGPPSNKAA